MSRPVHRSSSSRASAGISDVAWSPDGASIAASGGGGATIWDAATGSRRFALHGHRANVGDLDWGPISKVLATAGGDGTANVWVLVDGGPLQAFSLTAHDMRSGVGGVAFSPDGTRLLTGDGRVTNARVWDLAVTAGERGRDRARAGVRAGRRRVRWVRGSSWPRPAPGTP